MACAIMEETKIIQPYKTLTLQKVRTPTSNRFQALVQDSDMDNDNDNDNDNDDNHHNNLKTSQDL
eukprot:15307742-Heterocapsa_arctica.AAC.1